MIEKMIEELMKWCKSVKKSDEQPAKVQKEEVTSCKSKDKSKKTVLDELQEFLYKRYDFRYNLLSEQPEYRERQCADEDAYCSVNQRDLNTFCIEARVEHINCWDKDVSRLLNSRMVKNYHPFLHYMNTLPAWDGTDRVTPLAERISHKPLWVNGFHHWMLGVAAQWLGQAGECANALAPMLVSREQGKRKSSFCKILMPKSLTPYYIDKFDLTSESGCEQKLSLFGLINMDEFDKYRPGQMPTLKNLMQMTSLTFRKAHRPSFSSLPRIASFIATSNMTDLLTDPSGSRRYIVIAVTGPIDCSPIDYEQLYAQAIHDIYKGERYWFDAEDEKVMTESNQEFQVIPIAEQLFHQYFRAAREDEEEYELLLAIEILEQVQHDSRIRVSNCNIIQFGRILQRNQVPSIHAKRGNVYKVVRIKPKRA